jgi:NAD(P)-dependent dehydrogenase (short-subunit alcohol dehydrogenase family)
MPARHEQIGQRAGHRGIWDRVNDVNLKSMFLTCKHVPPLMERQGKRAIVNIASISGIRWLGVPYISYATTKAAVIQFTRGAMSLPGRHSWWSARR